MRHSPERSSFAVPYRPVPVPAPAPERCDISALLHAQRHDDLNKILREACEHSFETRAGEAFYTDRLDDFDRALRREGAPTLAHIKAWQAAAPSSGHACLIEAHYWHHWAHIYRGEAWSVVTDEDRACANAALANQCLAVLRALALDPRLWAAPVVMMKSLAAFSEPSWLRESNRLSEPEWLIGLLAAGTSDVTSARYSYALPEGDEAAHERLASGLARSGMALGDRLQVPADRPAVLPAFLPGKKGSEPHRYWMEVAFLIHPRLYIFLRQYVAFLRPSMDDHHAGVRRFLASERCAHLDAVETDRLMHEVWREEHQHCYANSQWEAKEAERALQAARRRAAEALHPYHRYEVLAWLARSLSLLDRETEALDCLKQAEAQHPIDDETVMQIGLLLALKHDAASTWLAQAVCRSAEGLHTVSAQILYGYFALRGLQGFTCDQAIGRAWMEAACRAGPREQHFRCVGVQFFEAEMMREAFELFQAGHDLGTAKCALELADMYEAGHHVEADAAKALRYYREAMEEGEGEDAAVAALNAAWLHTVMCESAPSDEVLAEHESAAIAAALRAHALQDDRALDRSFRYIANARTIRIRHEHMAWVERHAREGHAIAMAAWARMLGTPEDRKLYDLRESIRWLMGAQAVEPDDEYVQEVELALRGTGWMSKLSYHLTRRRIGAHEVPGTDSAMV